MVLHMKDDNLDKLMKKILIDALMLDWSNNLSNTLHLETSKKFQRRMMLMLDDPFAWYRKKTLPLWKKTIQTVATILIAFSVALSSIMVISPNVRAAVIRWVREWYDTHIIYRYTGESEQIKIPQYQITNLPKGYLEIERIELPGYLSVTYQNEDGRNLYLDYSFIQQGSASDFVTNNIDIFDVTIRGCIGQLFLSKDINQSSAITWINDEINIQFTIDGFFNRAELISMANSVSLID